jgi:hypothetical protein
VNSHQFINSLLDDSKDWFHEGYADQPWVKQLWTKYRPLCPAPTDGWKQKHDDSYYRNAVKGSMRLSYSRHALVCRVTLLASSALLQQPRQMPPAVYFQSCRNPRQGHR